MRCSRSYGVQNDQGRKRKTRNRDARALYALRCKASAHSSLYGSVFPRARVGRNAYVFCGNRDHTFVRADRQGDPDGARRELRKLFADSQMQMPGGMRELNYEYVDPKLKMQLQQRGGMGGFNPFGGRMGGGFWGGRR